jgi:hypothetical protein
MKPLFLILIVFIFTAYSCETKLHRCLRNDIIQFQKCPPTTPAYEIKVYKIKDEKFYFVPEPCNIWDGNSILYDGNCNVVCYPSGGIGGSGDWWNCPQIDFKNGPYEVYWKDAR